MSSGMPELGSKISLISKADIRYEGRLYTVDPQECTIALSSVRSFGTEDRDTQFKVAPQSQIYDYILFRGSDIKDIRVENNSPPQLIDPAIVQIQLPKGQLGSPQCVGSPQMPMPTTNYDNSYGAIPGHEIVSNANSEISTSAFPQSSNISSINLHSQQSVQSQQQQKNYMLHYQNQQNVHPEVSPSMTPNQVPSVKTPSSHTIQTTTQDDQQKQRQDHKQQINPNQRNHNGNSNVAEFKRTSQQEHADNKDLIQSNYNNRGVNRKSDGFNRNQPSTFSGFNRNMWNVHRNGPTNPNFTKYRNNVNIRNRPQQNFRLSGVPNNQNKQRNTKNAIKFDQDFDFEQANTKFEKLRLQLTKIKIAEDSKSSEEANADDKTEKKEDSEDEIENGAAEHTEQTESEEPNAGYDKTKSFFDNISCEAVQDRNKNKKTDWRQERKLNTETFGVSSTRRGGGFRPRGTNFYNRGTRFNANVGNGYSQTYRVTNNRNNRNYQSN